MAIWERALRSIAEGIALAWFKVNKMLPEVIEEVADEEQQKAGDAIRTAARSGFVRPTPSPADRPEGSPQDSDPLRRVGVDDETRRIESPRSDKGRTGVVDRSTGGGRQ